MESYERWNVLRRLSSLQLPCGRSFMTFELLELCKYSSVVSFHAPQTFSSCAELLCFTFLIQRLVRVNAKVVLAEEGSPEANHWQTG